MTLHLPSLRALAHLAGWHRGCGLACGRPTLGEVTPRWFCRLTRRHGGRVGYVLHSGPYWMCDNCGEVVR